MPASFYTGFLHSLMKCLTFSPLSQHNLHLIFFHVLSNFHHHHHHHVMLVAQIFLTLSCHSSLSFIALGRSSGQHHVSSHSCWMYVRAGRPTFARPCVGVHKSTSLMSSSLLLQQCSACLVRLTWIVFVIGAGGRTVGVLWGVAARTCSRLLAAFLCSSYGSILFCYKNRFSFSLQVSSS